MLIKMGCGGVDLSSLHPKMWDVIRWVSALADPEEIVITSTWEGTHCNHSCHYRKQALDFRLLQSGKFQYWWSETKYERLRKLLGKDFDIVVESDHLHVEYDPKG